MISLQHRLRAPLEELLVAGGDPRLTVDPKSGLNTYGCAPHPRVALAYGSCTASTISPGAYLRAEQARCDLLGRTRTTELLDEGMESLRRDLRQVLGLENGTAIVFSPSGTDSTVHALWVARALLGSGPIECVLVAADETGSSVPAALSGRHFSVRTAQGSAVAPGAPIAGLADGLNLVCVPSRNGAGEWRSFEEVDQEVFDRVECAVRSGNRVLLQIMDGSKLGLCRPSVACVQSIQRQFGDAVQIVVDACQMRLSRERLKWRLDQGQLALVSGSKFYSGPPFSGALLIPESRAAEVKARCGEVPGLTDYSARAFLPVDWNMARESLPLLENPGLYLRWTAAIHEMRAYYSVPADYRRCVLERFAATVTEAISDRRPDLETLEHAPTWTGGPGGDEGAPRTLFAFIPREDGLPVSFDRATALYKALNEDSADPLSGQRPRKERELASRLCHIGQPVPVRRGTVGRAGALRICASARTVSDLWRHRAGSTFAAQLENERQAIEIVLNKLALISRRTKQNQERAA